MNILQQSKRFHPVILNIALNETTLLGNITLALADHIVLYIFIVLPFLSSYPTERSDTGRFTQTSIIYLDHPYSSPPTRLNSHIPDSRAASVALTESVASSKTLTTGEMQQSHIPDSQAATVALAESVASSKTLTAGKMQQSHIPDSRAATVALAESVASSKTLTTGKMQQSAALGRGPILGIAIPSAVVIVVSATTVILCLCFRRKKQSTPKALHHFTGTGKCSVSVKYESIEEVYYILCFMQIILLWCPMTQIHMKNLFVA